MGKWDPRAIIVLILATAVAGGHLVAVILAAWHGKSVGEVGGDVLTAVLGAILAIIAAYVGRPGEKPSESRPGDDENDDTKAG